MNRKGLRTIAIALGALLLLGALPVGVIYLGRRVDWFDIDRVVINGAHLISPQELIDFSGIDRDDSLFDDSGPWLEAILGHPVVSEARLSRRFPSTRPRCPRICRSL